MIWFKIFDFVLIMISALDWVTNKFEIYFLSI